MFQNQSCITCSRLCLANSLFLLAPNSAYLETVTVIDRHNYYYAYMFSPGLYFLVVESILTYRLSLHLLFELQELSDFLPSY